MHDFFCLRHATVGEVKNFINISKKDKAAGSKISFKKL